MRWISHTARLVVLDDEVVGLESQILNITERKRVENQLLQNERDLVFAQEVARIGSWKYEMSSGCVQWSRELFKLYGCDPDTTEADLDLAFDRIHPDDKERMSATFERAVELGDSYRTDYRVVLPNGEVRVLQAIGEIVTDASGGVLEISGTGQDVTEARSREAQLFQSDRLSSMGMLAAGVAHEINNPLSYVLYNLESLAEDLPKLLNAVRVANARLEAHIGPEVFENILGDALDLFTPTTLNDIQNRFRDSLSGTHRIRDVVRGLGTFARVEQNEVVPVKLNDVIDIAIDLTYSEIKYRARLVKDLGKTPSVMASEGKLSQVFLNLIINATHAVGEADADENEIRIRTWVEGDTACAEVRDTGCGIPQENLSRLFEPFFTTKEIGEGSGLGLSISKNIIESYGGSITVESTPGKGTSFFIRIPTGTMALDGVARPSATPAEPRTQGRILIVDDEDGIRSAMVHMLRGHDTEEASSGSVAKGILEKDHNFDLVLCDMMMPDVSGMDLHEWLAREHPKLARNFIFITGGAFTPRARDYLKKIDNLRMEKPFDAANFKKIVANTIWRVKNEVHS